MAIDFLPEQLQMSIAKKTIVNAGPDIRFCI